MFFGVTTVCCVLWCAVVCCGVSCVFFCCAVLWVLWAYDAIAVSGSLQLELLLHGERLFAAREDLNPFQGADRRVLVSDLQKKPQDEDVSHPQPCLGPPNHPLAVCFALRAA